MLRRYASRNDGENDNQFSLPKTKSTEHSKPSDILIILSKDGTRVPFNHSLNLLLDKFKSFLNDFGDGYL